MNRALPPNVLALVAVLVLTPAMLAAQDSRPTALGPGPSWRGPVRPTASNEVFATGDGCAMCHSAAPAASAMRSPTGDDISPHGLWQSTLMANSFRDPYWRAQVAKESAAAPDQAAPTQTLCMRCHAPMAYHTAKLGGQLPLTIAAAATDPLAQDGVSCTVCHQVLPDGLGEERTFAGGFALNRERKIFGPYRDPAAGPMRMHSGYTPTPSPHIQSAGLCGSCHTLFTGHTGTKFAEQTPYLEWRNSAYQNEHDPAAEARTCQDCHMPRTSSARIARNPMGRDFLIPARPGYAAHAFVGGNAFMLDLLRTNRAALGVAAPEAALERTARATRRQLTEETARLTIDPLSRVDGRLTFAIHVENLTGHKFPTGYPSRRAWLHVQVRSGREIVFETGAVDDAGRLLKVADELSLPHVRVVEKPEDVVVYEMVALDSEGKPTTYLTKMARRAKDNRLLPKGWQASAAGADAAGIGPVGTEGDLDFTAGGDTVAFSIPVAADKAKGMQVIAWLEYQTIPPAWAAALRPLDAAEAKTFVTLYDAAEKSAETIAIASRAEE